MKVKKVLILLLCVLVMMGVGPGSVFAKDTDKKVQEEAGITPGSLLYGLDQMIENVQVNLTINDGNKTELLIEFANERLAEAQIISEENQQELLEKLIQSYSNTIKKANFHVEKMLKDIEDTDTNNDTDELTDDEAARHIEKNKKISSLIDKIEYVQNNADEITIKITGDLSEEQTEIIKEIMKAEVQNTIALQAYVLAKQNYVDSVKEFADAKKALGQARSTGDEEAIDEALLKVQQAEAKKKEMQELRKDVQQYKLDIMKENKEEIKELIDKDKDKDKGKDKDKNKEIKQDVKDNRDINEDSDQDKDKQEQQPKEKKDK